MARGRKKANDSTEPTAASTADHPQHVEGISKADAVRRAMAKLGKNGMPAAIRDYVKSEFGVEMSVNHISNIKSTMKKKRRGRPPGSGRVAAAEVVIHVPAAESPAMSHKRTGGIAVSDVEVVKELTQRIGAAELNALVDLLAQ